MKLFKNHSRVLAMLMALVMCLGMLPGVAHAEDDGHAHNYVYDRCAWEVQCHVAHDDVYKCTVCGAEKHVVAQTHSHQMVYEENSWITDRHTARCTKCGYEENLRHHSFSEATCKTPATCKCGKTEGSVNPENHVNTKVVGKVNATCGEAGYTGDTVCTDCGKTLSTGTKIDATGNHSWSDWALGDDGKEHRECTVCHKLDERDITTPVDPVDPPACEHTNFTSISFTYPTCGTNGSETFKCDDCGYEWTDNDTWQATGQHKYWTVNGKNPTCGEAGYTESVVCTVCGDVQKEAEVLKATGDHNVRNWTELDVNTHSGTCTVCGKDVAEAHTVGPDATCTEDQTCTKCGAVLKTSEGHVSVVDTAVAPTCNEAGLTEGSHCAVCGEVLTAQSTVSALGHNYTTVRVVDAAEHEHVCGRDNCGYSYTEAHSFGEWGEWVDGVRTRTCTHCGYGELDYLNDEPTDDDATVDPVAPVVPVAPVTPAPTEDEEIEDNDTPLTDAPVDVEPVEEPVTEPAADEEDISDNKTPLTGDPTADADVNADGEDDSSAVTAGEGIGDNDVPLADVPKTGDLSAVWYAATALSALGLTVLGRKKEEDDA